jgi:hypothetical protein
VVHVNSKLGGYTYHGSFDPINNAFTLQVWKDFIFVGCAYGNLYIYKRVSEEALPVLKHKMNLNESGIYAIKKIS